jgi:hypothetical protein
MTISPENFGNGSAKADDRFATQLSGYRPAARRDSGAVLPIDGAADGNQRNGNVTPMDRLGGGLDSPNPIGSSLKAPKLVEPELDSLGESAFGGQGWLGGPNGSMADHPLLRGLLLELPPKGSVPSQDWLDRWFEAARSILELLYSQRGNRH